MDDEDGRDRHVAQVPMNGRRIPGAEHEARCEIVSRAPDVGGAPAPPGLMCSPRALDGASSGRTPGDANLKIIHISLDDFTYDFQYYSMVVSLLRLPSGRMDRSNPNDMTVRTQTILALYLLVWVLRELWTRSTRYD